MKPKMLACVLGLSSLVSLLAGCSREEGSPNESVSVPYHVGMGKAFYRRGEYLSAVEMYQKAIGMDPQCTEAYLQLGIIYDDNLKDKRQALRYYRAFLQLEPDSEMAAMVKDWAREIEKTLPPEVVRPPPRSSAPKTPSVRLPIPSPQKKAPAPVPIPSPRPRPSPASAPVRAAETASRYTVNSGDTLAQLAIKFYGDRNAWKVIFEANRDVIAQPNILLPGTVLKIPPRGEGR